MIIFSELVSIFIVIVLNLEFLFNINVTIFLVLMDDGHIMILCMLKSQAKHLSKFNYFMVDMSYKRVFGVINELEFNAYDEDNKSSK